MLDLLPRGSRPAALPEFQGSTLSWSRLLKQRLEEGFVLLEVVDRGAIVRTPYAVLLLRVDAPVCKEAACKCHGELFAATTHSFVPFRPRSIPRPLLFPGERDHYDCGDSVQSLRVGHALLN